MLQTCAFTAHCLSYSNFCHVFSEVSATFLSKGGYVCYFRNPYATAILFVFLLNRSELNIDETPQPNMSIYSSTDGHTFFECHSKYTSHHLQ